MFGAVLFVLISILRLMYSLDSEYENTIFVFSSNSSRCSSPAFHIDNFSTVLTNSTDVKFCKTVIDLSTPLMIRNKTQIRLGSGATFNCSSGAGFVFENVDNLEIVGITTVNCGVLYRGNHSSIFVLNCARVTITNLTALNSKNIDLYVLSSRDITIDSGNFSKEATNSSVMVYVNFTGLQSYPLFRKSIVFINCTFGGEKVFCKNCTGIRSKHLKTELGGGLTIVLGQNATKVEVEIQNCTFQNLYSTKRGAFYLQLSGNAHNNTVSVRDSRFVKNLCFLCGGGGMEIDFLNDKSQSGGNNISLVRATFTENRAKYGGGIFMHYQKPSNCKYSNLIEFDACQWTENVARYGSAVDAVAQVSAGKYYPNTILKNCTFKSNKIRAVFIRGEITIFGQGTVSAVNFPLKFDGHTLFFHNRGSPLYLSSSYADFNTYSVNTFTKNKGLNGGAMILLGTSAIRARPASTFTFTENTAYFKGGAIYYDSIDGHIYLTSTNCFIQFINDTQPHKMPKYVFTNNGAGTAFNKNDSLGKSIYATTIFPCANHCGVFNGSYFTADTNTMACVGNFEYNNTMRRFELATAEWFMKLKQNDSLLNIIPGKEIDLPVETTDELGQKLNAVYKVTLWHKNSTNTEQWILPAYRYIHNSKIALRGKPSNDTLVLALTTVQNREIRLTIKVRIVPCPPGYLLDEESLMCRCSAELDWKYRYHGIVRCDSTAFRAKLQSGYWVGYSSNSSNSLVGSVCPRGFCFIFSNLKDVSLPDSFNISALDHLLCGNYRTGKLCAQCRENRSVYYNSNSYRCKKNWHCEIGWLLYGLAELVPVTGIFLAVTLFDIKLTSGTSFGLILYYQLLDTMLLNANNIIRMPHLTFQFYRSHRVLSQMLNLNFFRHNSLSFCLWKGATTLDIIAFKYFTVVYALLMVFLTILIIKTCNYAYFCVKLRRATRRREVTNSVIHGISGFFILCYSECVRVSLLLLKPIKYEDPLNSLNSTLYVFYNGEMKYFGGAHLKYAIPALFFLTTIVILPPLLLISYPLCYRILALFRVQESTFSRVLCMLIPLERMKPFLDSFQGSFKDKHRYTSGLYFVYRSIAVSLAVFTTHNMSLFYTLLEFLLLVMIFTLAYCQPHKKRQHNRQDLFVLVILAAVNALTFYNFKKSVDVTDERNAVNVTTTIQILLLYVPTIYVAVRVILFLIRLVFAKCCTTTRSEVGVDETELLERDLMEESDLTHQYNMILDGQST